MLVIIVTNCLIYCEMLNIFLFLTKKENIEIAIDYYPKK
jgi:hypothetical protein